MPAVHLTPWGHAATGLAAPQTYILLYCSLAENVNCASTYFSKLPCNTPDNFVKLLFREVKKIYFPLDKVYNVHYNKIIR